MTCALLIIGTASKSKVSRVLPGGRRASARWRSMRRRARSAISCSASAARKRAAGQPFLVGPGGEVRPDQLDGGQAQLGEQQARGGRRRSAWGASCRLSRGGRCRGGPRRRRAGRDRPRRARRRPDRARSGAARPDRAAGRRRDPDRRALGEFGLAGPLVGQGQQADHGAAGASGGQLGGSASKARAIGRPGEELVAVDQVEQRHRLAAQRVDDVPVVDDMAVLAAGDGPAARQRQLMAAAEIDTRAGRRRGAPAADGRSGARARCRTPCAGRSRRWRSR